MFKKILKNYIYSMHLYLAILSERQHKKIDMRSIK